MEKMKISEYENNLHSLYTTIFSLKYSPDGNILAASDFFGHISLFRFDITVYLNNCLLKINF